MHLHFRQACPKSGAADNEGKKPNSQFSFLRSQIVPCSFEADEICMNDPLSQTLRAKNRGLMLRNDTRRLTDTQKAVG